MLVEFENGGNVPASDRENQRISEMRLVSVVQVALVGDVIQKIVMSAITFPDRCGTRHTSET